MFGRVLRAGFAGGTFAGAVYLGQRWMKRGENAKHMPAPLPEMEGQTDDELLADTVHRYARMAPVYDELLDNVEARYRGFDLRKELIQSAHGHVLEIGVGTARNVCFYDSSKVQSLTFVDSTYPMLNAALVKMYDLYTHHGVGGLLIGANQFFTFKTLPLLQPKDPKIKQDILTQRQKQQQQQQQENKENKEEEEHQQDEQMEISKQTLRPQLLLPSTISPELNAYLKDLSTTTTDPTTGSTTTTYGVQHTLNALLLDIIGEKFPSHIAHLFSSSSSSSSSSPTTTTTPLTTDQTAALGEHLYDVQDMKHIMTDVEQKYEADFAAAVNNPTKDEQSAAQRLLAGKEGRWSKPPDALTEEELLKKRQEQLKLGERWRDYTTTKNVIPAVFIHLDCHDLDFFPANSYDTVVDTFGLCSFHHPVDVVKKMQRICKPGGKLLLLEHGLGTGFLINGVIKRTNDTHKKHWGCDRAKDIVQILKDAGVDVQHLKREHSGSTIILNGHPQKSAQEVQEFYGILIQTPPTDKIKMNEQNKQQQQQQELNGIVAPKF